MMTMTGIIGTTGTHFSDFLKPESNKILNCQHYQIVLKIHEYNDCCLVTGSIQRSKTCMMMTGTTGMTGTTCITTGTTLDMTWTMMEMLTGGDGKDKTKEY